MSTFVPNDSHARRHELDRRRRAEFHQSLQKPHPENAALAEERIEEWTRGLPEEDTAALVDSTAGKPILWIAGEGWLEGSE